MCIDDVNIHYVFSKSLGRGEQFSCDTGKLFVNFEKNRVQNSIPCKLSVSLISRITTIVRSVGPLLNQSVIYFCLSNTVYNYASLKLNKFCPL